MENSEHSSLKIDYRKAAPDDIDEILSLYEEARFLDPKKKERVNLYMETIKNNWIKGLSSKSKILWTVISKNPHNKQRASLSAWKTTNKSMVAQHLTSNKCPAIVALMLKSVLEDSIANGCHSGQLWFRPDNSKINKFFTPIFEQIKEDTRYVKTLSYFDVYPDAVPFPAQSVLIQPCEKKHVSELYNFVIKNRGKVFADAEDLGNEDISLSELDTLYQKFSLRRRRYCWIAYDNYSPVGAAIAYRGPFGFNLSLLENRCELIIDPFIEEERLKDIIAALIHAAKAAYPIKKDTSDALFYPFEFIPVLVEPDFKQYFDRIAIPFKTYNHCIWLNDGFKEWLQVTKDRYKKVMDRAIKIHSKMSSNIYAMEDPREGERLAEKVNSAEVVKTYILEHFSDEGKFLDVGCGPGVICREIKKQVPDSTVVGVDTSFLRTVEARKNLDAYPQAYAVTADGCCLPFRSDFFDMVFARFLFQFIKQPETLLSEMIRVCKPGKTIMIQDLDGQLLWHYPPDADLEKTIQDTLSFLSKNYGFDPFVGRKLYYYMHSAGLQDIRVKPEIYHLYPGKISEKDRKLWELKFSIILPKVSGVVGGVENAEKWKERFMNYLLREDTMTYSVLFTVSGKKPK